MSEKNEKVILSNEEMEKVNGGVVVPNDEGGVTVIDGNDQHPDFSASTPDDLEKIRKQLGL